jgi:hypothetical protein
MPNPSSRCDSAKASQMRLQSENFRCGDQMDRIACEAYRLSSGD